MCLYIESLLRAAIKGLPWDDKVNSSQYHIMDTQRHGLIMKPADWTRSVFPGAILSMSSLLPCLRRACQRCSGARNVELHHQITEANP